MSADGRQRRRRRRRNSRWCAAVVVVAKDDDADQTSEVFSFSAVCDLSTMKQSDRTLLKIGR